MQNTDIKNTDKPQDISEAARKKKVNLDIELYKKNWSDLCEKGYSSKLIVKNVPIKGLGVFADRDYKALEVLDYFHCIISGWRSKYIGDPQYRRYAYWSLCDCDACKEHGARGLILLGAGSVINSAATEAEGNIEIVKIISSRLAVAVARRDIIAGEEIVTWHGQDYYDGWCAPRYTQATETKKEEAKKQTLQALI